MSGRGKSESNIDSERSNPSLDSSEKSPSHQQKSTTAPSSGDETKERYASQLRRHLVGDLEIEGGKWRILGWREQGGHSHIYDVYGREDNATLGLRTFTMKLSKGNTESLRAAGREMDIYKELMNREKAGGRFLTVYAMGVIEELHIDKKHNAGPVTELRDLWKVLQKEDIEDHFTQIPCIIMEKVNHTIAKIRCLAPPDRSIGFPDGFAVTLALGCFRAICALHDFGFIHRHITPRNFGIRLAENYKFPRDVQSGVVLFDLGLSKQYPAAEPPKRRVEFAGSTRYSSINTHNFKEQGPVDDFWSLFYMIVEWCSEKERLPWYKDVEDIQTAGEMKRNWSVQKLAHLCPSIAEDLTKLGEVLESASVYRPPSTQTIENILQEAIEKHKETVNPTWIPFSS